ncbi:MAG: acyl-CoA dehydrogenase [Alphaproteobacteria bacterium]|nr:acyl-CoA dehydrogenase [Alphaproteobacteria bacterium]
MPSYNAPLRDMRFVLHEVLGVGNYQNLPGFEDASPDTVDAVIEEGAKFAQEVLQPINQSGDREGCKWDAGNVTTPKGFKEAYKQYCEGGWTGLTSLKEYGGQGLPYYVGVLLSEIVTSANMAWGMYPGLSHGAYEAIAAHGSDELKKTYLPKLVSGEWTGTMNLTEPHCGTDLGLMRTKAEPQPDGSYRITGTKIFISAGEHDMTDNIVHLVLAKIVGGPEGIRGVSLFIVPKFLPNADGSPGERNGVSCGSIEHKMGIKANATAVLNYDNAKGWLVGKAHKGMRGMFTMMNAARLGVGVQGLGLAEVSYQNGLAYAKERVQGRSLGGIKAPDKAADPIIVHPDVRRMLLTCKAFTEGARMLTYWAGLNVDLAHKHPDAMARREADDLLGLITPIVKAYQTDMGFECANLAMQCLGGHGYIAEWGMEQFVRDARIAQIYEGANGVQALDLVGRKLPANMGRSLRTFFHPLDAFLKEQAADAAMKDFIGPLLRAFGRLQQATALIAEKGMADAEEAGAASSDYLRLFALTAVGWMWAKMARVAIDKLAAGGGEDPGFYRTKLATARFFMERMLPDTASLQQKIQAGKRTLMELDAAAF